MNLRTWGLLLLSVVLALPIAAAGDNPLHLVTPTTVANKPTGLGALDAQVKDAAGEYAQYAPVPRAAFLDSALPADADEYASLQGYGVLVITAVSQQKDELPLKRVYARISGKEVQLRLFKGAFAAVSGDEDVKRVLGKYRWDGVYYYPIYLIFDAKDLLLDFSKGRDGFVLTRYHSGDVQPPPGMKVEDITAPIVEQPPADAFLRIVGREYPGLMEQLDKETNASP